MPDAASLETHLLQMTGRLWRYIHAGYAFRAQAQQTEIRQHLAATDVENALSVEDIAAKIRRFVDRPIIMGANPLIHSGNEFPVRRLVAQGDQFLEESS